jgi:Glycosyl transferase family 2.
VIPNFNNADMLGRCLFNIRKLYPKHEIIVCDDASKEIDAVEKVCSIYNAKLKKIFSQQWI